MREEVQLKLPLFDIKVGDKVEVIRVVKFEKGWHNVWSHGSMTPRIGLTGVVTEIRPSGVYITGDGGRFGWPKGALRAIWSS